MARNNGGLVVATQDWHPETTPALREGRRHLAGPLRRRTRGARRSTRTWRLPDDAPRVRKGANGEDGYSGFTMRDPVTGETVPTELEGLLRDAGIERVVVVGPRDRLLRQGDRARCGPARLRDGAPDRRDRRGRPRAGRRRPRPSTRCVAAGVTTVAHGDAMIRGAASGSASSAPASATRSTGSLAETAKAGGPEPDPLDGRHRRADRARLGGPGRHRGPAALDARDEGGPDPDRRADRRRHDAARRTSGSSASRVTDPGRRSPSSSRRPGSPSATRARSRAAASSTWRPAPTARRRSCAGTRP